MPVSGRVLSSTALLLLSLSSPAWAQAPETASSPQADAPTSTERALRRIFVIANKRWEAEPVASVLLSRGDKEREAQKKAGSLEVCADHGFQGGPPCNDRTTLTPADSTEGKEGEDVSPLVTVRYPEFKAEVTVWCLQDLTAALEKELAPKDPKDKSTQRKVSALDTFFKRAGAPDLVISVGTAGWDSVVPNNGSVVVGSRAFIHHPEARGDWALYWKVPAAFLNKPLSSPSGGDVDSERLLTTFFEKLDSKPSDSGGSSPPTLRSIIESRLIEAPNAPGLKTRVEVTQDGAALSTVNVLEDKQYSWADLRTIATFKQIVQEESKYKSWKVGSVDTTHGVIRAASNAPFLYVSGIVNRVGQFAQEVDPSYYSQNFVGAHNAGVVLAWMLPEIAAAMKPPPPPPVVVEPMR